jgi:hypothetical protein
MLGLAEVLHQLALELISAEADSSFSKANRQIIANSTQLKRIVLRINKISQLF